MADIGSDSDRVFLRGGGEQYWKLSEREEITHNSFRLRFALDTSQQVVGVPPGRHVLFFCNNRQGSVPGEWNGKPDTTYPDAKFVRRPYTPISGDTRGYVDFVIKAYRPGARDGFPDGGKASEYLDSVKVGDKVMVSGPIGMRKYVGGGNFAVKDEIVPNGPKTRIGMIAGGTGLTPLLAIMQKILSSCDAEEIGIEISFLFANDSEDDILCRNLLEKFAADHPKRFKLWYTLSHPPAGWKFSSGRVNSDMIKEHMPAAGDGTICCICGPPGMSAAAADILEEAGHKAEHILVF